MSTEITYTGQGDYNLPISKERTLAYIDRLYCAPEYKESMRALVQ